MAVIEKLTLDSLVKVTGPRGEAIHGGSGVWSLPDGAQPGAWMPRIEDLAPCVRGYHVVSVAQAAPWLKTGCALWRVEARGPIINQRNKSVAAEARLLAPIPWGARAERLFAADCAEHVLHLFEARRPGDERPRAAIKAARDFANGLVSDEMRVAAAYVAAAAAAAADAAAYAAAAYVAAAYVDAAYVAAAAAAAAYVAREEEQRWQAERLLAYLNGEVL
jgi:hypothetical protein